MNYKKIFACLFFICIIIYMILFPERAVLSAKNALTLCYDAILPTLFVFLVCSAFLINVGFARILKKPFEPIMRPLFGIDGAGALAMVLGYISGYPVGAVCVCDLYKSGDIKKREAEHLLGFCNNAGPLFVIGLVGAVMLKDKRMGYLLCIIHIVSSIISGIVLRIFSGKGAHKNIRADVSFMSTRLVQAITDSVKSALMSVLTICAYTVLFSVILSMTFDFFEDTKLGLIFRGMTEMTNGVSRICESRETVFSGIREKLTAIAFILGFGGLCVHLQVISIVKKTDLKMDLYFAGKTIQAITAALLVYLLTTLIL